LSVSPTGLILTNTILTIIETFILVMLQSAIIFRHGQSNILPDSQVAKGICALSGRQGKPFL
jgi:hypothetical protein